MSYEGKPRTEPKPFSVLFVCKANRFRSPIAAQYFSHVINLNKQHDNLIASSAGTWTRSDLGIMPEALFLENLFPINLRNHHSRIICERLISESDLILTMTSDQKEALSYEFPSNVERIFMLTEAAGCIPYDIPDLYVTDTPPEEIAFEIITIIDKGYESIVTLAKSMREANT